MRIADTHLPGGERKTAYCKGRCGSRARLVLEGDAVGTGKGCRQEVRRGAHVCGSGHAHQSGLVEEVERLIIAPTRRQSRGYRRNGHGASRERAYARGGRAGGGGRGRTHLQRQSRSRGGEHNLPVVLGLSLPVQDAHGGVMC